MKHKIFFATQNKAKQLEIERYARQYDVQVFFPEQKLQVDETGDTFAQNAKLKAEKYKAANRLCDGCVFVGDDSGLEIPVLNNEPGVRTKRWNGSEMTDEQIKQYSLERLRNFTGHDRRAFFKTTLVAVLPNGSTKQFTGSLEGEISSKPINGIKPISGFPFRDIFIVSETSQPISSLQDSKETKVKTHRQKALEMLFNGLSNE